MYISLVRLAESPDKTFREAKNSKKANIFSLLPVEHGANSALVREATLEAHHRLLASADVGV